MGRPRPAKDDPAATGGLPGTVVAVFGRRFEVESDNGERFDCVARARKREAACGDRVTFHPTGSGLGVIDAVLPRTRYLERADRVRRKAIAANADQLLVLVAVEPWFSDEFVTRVLLLADAAGMDTLIALNKVDLPGADAARERLRVFERAGHAIIEIAAKPRDAAGARLESPQGTEALRQRLSGRATVLAGQSGMGKSSLVNALLPGANAATGEISQALGSGRHTTTFSRLYRLDAVTTLIDCPGMQEVGLAHLEPAQLLAGFHDFAPHLAGCRFANCRHDREPGCSLTAAVASGSVDARRYELYSRFRTELAVPAW
jgi:ribosome biogenesis GTPase